MGAAWFLGLWLGIPFSIVGGISLRIAFLGWRDRGAANWPTVAGQVVAIDMDVTMRRVTRGPAYEHYRLRVRYRYTVDGEDYRAWEHVHEDVRQPPYPSVQEVFAGRYVDGQRVPVYYHPQQPERSFLDPSSGSRREILTTTIATLVILSLVTVAIAYILTGTGA